MTELLQQAIAPIEKLPAKQQNAIALNKMKIQRFRARNAIEIDRLG